MNASRPEISVVDLKPTTDVSKSRVLKMLQREPKQISSELFYDAEGSRLFEEICKLPEYYVTRTELGVLTDNVGEIARELGPSVTLVELGSGSSLKTRVLLDELEHPHQYVPIDISKDALLSASAEIARSHPALEVTPVCADFFHELRLPKLQQSSQRIAVFFPGSTIGNFDRPHRSNLLRSIAAVAGKDGALLLGIDLRKDRQVLERAYNDAQGITAEFNRNILRVLNRELEANFDLSQWRHLSIYNEKEHRIEMHLESLADQSCTIAETTISFGKGERIHTENSYKFDLEEFREEARESGFDTEGVWTDANRYFAIVLLTVSP